MGNCCGSQAADYESGRPANPGRRARAGGVGHTLGVPSDTGADPRTAAALAAEVLSAIA